MNINSIPFLNVKIADTPELQAKGLMFVKNMSRDSGMLFVFSRSQKLSFWGENTFLPLDIAFVDESNKICNIEIITPFSKKSVSSKSSCKYAIEANLGFFDSNGIRTGDSVVFDKESNVVKFVKKNSKEILGQKVSQLLQQKQNNNDVSNLDEFYQKYDEEQKAKEQNNSTNPVIDSNLDEDENLPTLNQEEIGQYIEDSIQEQQERQQEEGLEVEDAPTLDDLEPKSPNELEEEIPRFSNISDAFNWGQQNKQVIKISYQTTFKKKGIGFFGNNSIVRYVEPHGRFTSHPDDGISHEILVTFDETVGGIRAFRMQNVKEFSFVGRKFKPKFKVR